MTAIILIDTLRADTETGAGHGTALAQVGGVPVSMYTYRPPGCDIKGLLVVFAGYARNAEANRFRASMLAARLCYAVVAPKLDRDRFPRRLYQRAGIGREDTASSAPRCMGALVSDVVDWGRTRFGLADQPAILFGHSAGGQFLSRVTAYCPVSGIARIVVTNPSSHASISLEAPAPFGFRDWGSRAETQVALKAYLAQPLTIFIGTADKEDHRLSKGRWSQRQGANRYERAVNVYREAEALTRRKGWAFNWRLVKAADVGHSSFRMLNSPEVIDAIQPL